MTDEDAEPDDDSVARVEDTYYIEYTCYLCSVDGHECLCYEMPDDWCTMSLPGVKPVWEAEIL